MSVEALFDDAQRVSQSHKSLAKRLRKLEVKHRQRGRSEEFEDQVRQCTLKLFEVAKSEAAGNRIVKFLGTYFSTEIEVDATAQKPKSVKQQQPQRYQAEAEEDEGEDSMMTDAPDPEEEEEEIAEEEDKNEDANPVASAVLTTLVPYLCAKDKTVRYRTIQLVSTILASINEIEDALYTVVRHELIKRLRDRVPAIRLEAVLMLGQLVENEMENAESSKLQDDDEDSDYDEESNQASGLLEKLLDVLQNDTNADVRRALLINLPIHPTTLPYLMERARDKDANTRRAFYAKVAMQRLGDFRHLGMNMREKLLRWGLRDRDERVRKATARMFREKWVEDCARTLPRDEDGNALKKDKTTGYYEASMPALLELLERIDVVNTGAEGGMANDAMKEFWSGRPDYLETVTLGDDFWSSLRAESAFMARTWIVFCQQSDRYRDLLEEQMPEVTRFGFHLQKHLNDLTEKLIQNESLDTEEDTTEQEFVVEQLLYIAHTLDYTDEIGRRKMFSLLRNSISIPLLPEECTRLAIEALRLTCNSDAAGEKEFTSIILEAIAEVHDTINSDNEDAEGNDNAAVSPGDEDSFVSARSEVSHSSTSTTTATKPNTSTGTNQQPSKSRKSFHTAEEAEAHRIREILINLKCLAIAHSMLQNIAGPIITDINLEGMLDSLILPSVRSHDAPVRLKALSCLGLCCLIEPRLAVMNWSVFEHCLRRGDDPIKTLSLQVFCDVLMSMQARIVAAEDTDSNGRKDDDVLRFDLAPFVKAFEYSADVQNVATTSLGKLMLCGFYSGSRAEMFDEIVEAAESRTVKGWEILGKVRMAMGSTDAAIGGGAEPVAQAAA